jgi:two-component system nitrogen regulation sensor histidine kinase GlnL
MIFRRNENKAWLALTIFVVALLFIISLSLSLYSQALRKTEAQRLTQFKLQATLLASLLSQIKGDISNSSLHDLLQANQIVAQVAIYTTTNSVLVASATTAAQPLASEAMQPNLENRSSVKESIEQDLPSTDLKLQNRNHFQIVEILINKGSRILVLAFPEETEATSLTYYLFSYQVVALIIGLLLIYFLIRWLLRPYRRMVEAAQGSPVRASAAKSESEFVVETFQALVQQLQAKETELAQLHELERRRAERSERFSERLIINIPSGLVAVNAKRMITTANKYALHLFNFLQPAASLEDGNQQETQTHPQGFESFFSSAPALIDMISQCLKTGITFKREEIEIFQTDGTLRRLGLSVSPIIDAAQQIEGALCMMTDITEVSDLRERIKLQETLANLGEMAAGLAHEFKNSLATIQGYAQLFDLQSEANISPNQQRNTVDSMLKEVELLSRLVSDFLNFARPQNLNLSLVDLHSLIYECVNELRPQLEKDAVAISISGDFITLSADESLLRRVFLNLIRNAIEAIDTDSPTRQIDILGAMDKGTGKPYAHIRVCDTGTGISREDLHHIFIPFFTTKSRGYGIGLAIVQKILVAHGGDVAVERSDATGTVFHCRLPLSPYPLSVKK